MAKRQQFEGSPQDEATDAREAKKRGIPQSQWEGSPEDSAMDAEGERQFRKGHEHSGVAAFVGGREAEAADRRSQRHFNTHLRPKMFGKKR